jgi:hypothetical protein
MPTEVFSRQCDRQGRPTKPPLLIRKRHSFTTRRSSVPPVRIPLPLPVCPRRLGLRMNQPVNEPNSSGNLSFLLRTSDRHSSVIDLRMPRFSLNLWTPSIRYGFRNPSVWSYLLTSADSSPAASLGLREHFAKQSRGAPLGHIHAHRKPKAEAGIVTSSVSCRPLSCFR